MNSEWVLESQAILFCIRALSLSPLHFGSILFRFVSFRSISFAKTDVLLCVCLAKTFSKYNRRKNTPRINIYFSVVCATVICVCFKLIWIESGNLMPTHSIGANTISGWMKWFSQEFTIEMPYFELHIWQINKSVCDCVRLCWIAWIRAVMPCHAFGFR